MVADSRPVEGITGRPNSKQCWGCNTQNIIPEQGLETVKCGWCGCTISLNNPTFQASPTSSRRVRHSLNKYRYCIPAGASILILIITLLAVHFILNPLLGASPWHLVMPVGFVPKSSLDDCSLCTACHVPKPPRTHHCRTCERCVPECCHHCIFLGQCVGAHNQRHFLLFLAFTITGCCYILYLAASLLRQRWPVVLQWWHHESPPMFPQQWWRATGLLTYQARMLWSAPGWLSAVTWEVLATLNSGLGLTALLVRQLRFVLSGHGYIDRMQAHAAWQASYETRVAGLYQLRRVFAFEPVICWLRPAWRYPSVRDKRCS
ncbi:hypothetical protein WJX84_003210 [Apatococcus fuscideae]|uniref:S-acyltransferase n=1 Tax=Apatococcus fuscideae TaxID=2026836 RepID=A0AAW1T1P0_9CHLO